MSQTRVLDKIKTHMLYIL